MNQILVKLQVAVILGFFISSLAAADEQAPGKSSLRDARQSPNVVFIVADDLGYGDLGCYGQKKIRTPNLDRLCHEGMKFTNHYSGCNVCAPSRCVLMTGMHPGHGYIQTASHALSAGRAASLQEVSQTASQVSRIGCRHCSN